jgi:hypothetical protein
MKAKTKRAIRRYVYLVAGLLAGVAEVVRNSGDITTLTWQEMLDKALKAVPFVLLGWVAKNNLDKTPPSDVESDDAGKS